MTRETIGAFTDGEWQSLEPVTEGDGESQALVALTNNSLRDELALITNADTLVVLAGSGTSLGLLQSDGSKLAPSMADLWDAVSALPEFQAVEDKLDSSLVGTKNLEHVLSHAQAKQALNTDDKLDDFVAAAEATVLDRCSFVNSDTDVSTHEIFLRKVARRSTRLQRTQLFTTNYDLAFEAAARRVRFNVVDGFGYSGREFDGASFDLDFVRRRPGEPLALEPSVLHLLKLHGSVDWNAEGVTTHKVVGRPKNPVLIYPSAAKYQLSYRQPYLEFMSRFQIALRQPDVGLILVGFGLNDDHLNAPIEAALRSNIGLRAVVVTPGARADSRSGSIEWIEDLIRRGDRRLSMLAGTFDDLVQFLPDKPLQEERDAHADRMSQWRTKEAP